MNKAMMPGASQEELARARAIYDEQIVPLMKRINTIAQEHDFFYVAAFQYNYYGAARFCRLHSLCDQSLYDAWAIIGKAVEDESEGRQ